MKFIKKIRKFIKPEDKSSNEVILRYNEKKQLKDKVVLITGAGKGIGRAIAKCFADQGAKIFINSRTLNDLEKLKNEIKNLGGDCYYNPSSNEMELVTNPSPHVSSSELKAGTPAHKLKHPELYKAGYVDWWDRIETKNRT